MMVFGGQKKLDALRAVPAQGRSRPWMRSATRCGIYLLLG